MKYTQVKISIEPLIEGRELIYHYFGDSGYDLFEEEPTGVSAYIPAEKFNGNVLEEHLGNLKKEFKITHEIIDHPDVNWNAEWESNFDPIDVDGKLYIRAPFHEKKEGAEEIIILPQMSFGTGHHETTWLMARKCFDYDFKNKRVLDIGCGTGILAILASKLGASNVLAIDIEEWAYRNTLENIALNHAINIDVEKGDAQLLAGHLFNIILANINLNVLLADMKIYASVLDNKGVIFFSGIFETDLPRLKQAALEQGLELREIQSKNGWLVAIFTK